MRKINITCITLLACLSSLAQNETAPVTDSLYKKYLPEVTIVGRGSKSDYQQMPEIVGVSIYAGKKNALIVLDNIQGNVVTNNMRQVMAKIPGIHIWESDGSGIQIGIAARGLSPNRSWEFNTRQNGYDIAADPYGYPEAYYNPQLQAVQRIEIVRGQGALQYGPQFGGMVNYILRNGSEINKPFSFETQQTIGSNGLFNSYNAIGGKTKRSNYYAFFDHRNANGWRQNSRYYTNAGFGSYTYQLSNKFSVTAELMQSNIRSQQPGGLTDSSFNINAGQSSRSRNWFDIKWTTLAAIANYQFKKGQRLNVKLFAVLGNRKSVGFLPSGGIIINDTINKTTGDYNARNLSADQYRNFGFEARYLGDYKIGRLNNTFSTGIRLYKGNTYRYVADGKGSTGMDYDMSVTGGTWTRDIDFESKNAAVFIENIFRFYNSKLLVIPGIRYEYITAKVSGINGYSAGNPVLLQPQQRGRSFLLAGIGAEYHLGKKTEIYANISQAYRPVQFADLTTPPTTDSVDQDLKDAKGYNLDIGYRGKISNYLVFDISGYYMSYDNRIGTIAQQRSNGSFYNYRTNIGNSFSRGFEGMIEINPAKAFLKNNSLGDISLFVSYSYTNAIYGNMVQVSKNSSNQLVETNLKDKKVENAPENIIRTGLSYYYKGLIITGQMSYVDETFSDANNTVKPTANGQNGLIPSYRVIDFTASYTLYKFINIKTGINNLLDKAYFTRRSGGYPGPGVLPADGRSFFLSIGAKF